MQADLQHSSRSKLRCLAAAVLACAALSWAGCSIDKIAQPDQPDNPFGGGAVSDTTYLQLRPVWGVETGYSFSNPSDVLLGREPLVYVADTGNDRIVQMDLAGNILGESQAVPTPVAITQDSKLNLLIVSGDNRIFRINLTAASHQIATAPVELMFEEVDNPDRQYTGISAILQSISGRAAINYYVTATGGDRRDNQVVIFPEDFQVRVPDAINLEPNGLGILSASAPSGITSLRDFSQDFIFCMVGQNNFKVQWITSSEFGVTAQLNPANGNFDMFEPGKFSMPEDVTVDLEGNIYVIDAEQNFLFKFSSGGEEQQSFGGTGAGENQFNQPRGVAFFDKTLYVADTGNNRIVRFKLSTDVQQ